MNRIKKMFFIIFILMSFLLVACKQSESNFVGIVSATGFEIDGTTMYTEVPTTTTMYSFIDQITVSSSATWDLYSDIIATNKIASKTISLSIGDNTVYILVTKADEIKLYTCTVKRLSFEITIKGYVADITLNDAGDMLVEETLTLNYPDGYHVIYRDVVYDKGPATISTDNAYLDESSFDVKVYDRNGDLLTLASTVACTNGDCWVGYSFNNDRDELGYIITCPPEITAKTSECDSAFVYVKEGMQSEMTFKFTYTITGAVTVYNDVAQLNWKLIEYFDNEVTGAKVNISLPANAFPVDDYYLFGHGPYSGIIDEITKNDEMSMSFNMDNDDFLEFRLLTPVGLFPNARPENIVNADKKDIILAEELEMTE